MILLQIVMVSPGIQFMKNHESQFKKEIKSPWVFCNHIVNLKTDSKTLYFSLLKYTV